MFLLKVTSHDYHRKGYMQRCLEVVGFTHIDTDFKRIALLAMWHPCVRSEIFQITIEPNQTTSLEISYTKAIFRFVDGHTAAYRRIKLMGGKDNGPPYPDSVWVNEEYRHYLIEYQI